MLHCIGVSNSTALQVPEYILAVVSGRAMGIYLHLSCKSLEVCLNKQNSISETGVTSKAALALQNSAWAEPELQKTGGCSTAGFSVQDAGG